MRIGRTRFWAERLAIHDQRRSPMQAASGDEEDGELDGSGDEEEGDDGGEREFVHSETIALQFPFAASD